MRGIVGIGSGKTDNRDLNIDSERNCFSWLRYNRYIRGRIEEKKETVSSKYIDWWLMGLKVDIEVFVTSGVSEITGTYFVQAHMMFDNRPISNNRLTTYFYSRL